MTDQDVSVLAFFSGVKVPLEIKCNSKAEAIQTAINFNRSDGFLKTVTATVKFYDKRG